MPDPPASANLRCYLCGATDLDRYYEYPWGTAFCAVHPWCDECGVAHLQLPCPEQLGRIVQPAMARAAVRAVLTDLDQLGVRLPRVPVQLVPALPEPKLGTCRTTMRDGPQGSRGASIQIRAGLGPTRFGHTVAHEHTHALIHLQSTVELDPALEEGICELVGVVWLTSRGTDREVLSRVWHNTDPVYGAQLRRVVAIARRAGVGATLQSVLSTGRLP